MRKTICIRSTLIRSNLLVISLVLAIAYQVRQYLYHINILNRLTAKQADDDDYIQNVELSLLTCRKMCRYNGVRVARCCHYHLFNIRPHFHISPHTHLQRRLHQTLYVTRRMSLYIPYRCRLSHVVFARRDMRNSGDQAHRAGSELTRLPHATSNQGID